MASGDMQKICTLKNIGKNSAKKMHYCICTFGGCQFFQKIKKPGEKCIFFAYFIKNQRKLPKIGDMQKICRKYALFQKYLGKVKIVKNCKKTSRRVHIFCIFHQKSKKIVKNWRYAKNMQKICTFPKIFGKGQNSQKLQKTWRKEKSAYLPHIFCIFFAYHQFLAIFFDF